MSNGVAQYVEGATLDHYVRTWLDDSGTVRDLSDYALEVIVWPRRGTDWSFLPKVVGIIGSNAAPNVTIDWDVDTEISTLAAGLYNVQINAEKDGKRLSMVNQIWIRQGAPMPPDDEVFLDGGTP